MKEAEVKKRGDRADEEERGKRSRTQQGGRPGAEGTARHGWVERSRCRGGARHAAGLTVRVSRARGRVRSRRARWSGLLRRQDQDAHTPCWPWLLAFSAACPVSPCGLQLVWCFPVPGAPRDCSGPPWPNQMPRLRMAPARYTNQRLPRSRSPTAHPNSCPQGVLDSCQQDLQLQCLCCAESVSTGHSDGLVQVVLTSRESPRSSSMGRAKFTQGRTLSQTRPLASSLLRVL